MTPGAPLASVPQTGRRWGQDLESRTLVFGSPELGSTRCCCSEVSLSPLGMGTMGGELAIVRIE